MIEQGELIRNTGGTIFYPVFPQISIFRRIPMMAKMDDLYIIYKHFRHHVENKLPTYFDLDHTLWGFLETNSDSVFKKLFTTMTLIKLLMILLRFYQPVNHYFGRNIAKVWNS